jgi:ATP-dependent exoDNAse (exonuclease V) beta subunit
MLETQQTAWRVRPSLIVQDPLPELQTRIVPLDVPPQAASLVATASERGTALHKAMRVLLLRPDLRLRLSAATGFDEATLDLLQAQGDALKQWLTGEGYTQIECEVPIQDCEASGAEFNGIIDLVAKGDGKCLILDHKSGLGTFAAYFAQLRAYQKVLVHADQTGFAEIAIHWIDRATLEIKDGSSQVD